MKANRSKSINVQESLEEELEGLKKKLGLGYELQVSWVPDKNSALSGEVVEEKIFIYENKYEKAFETLKHEFLDYAISGIIEPYKKVTNKLIMLINEEAYMNKEKLVKALSQLIK